MLVLAGNLTGAAEDEHFVPSDDGKAGLWFGNVDDLWIMGSPKGEGGPCLNTPMEAGRPSDPYLMTGYAHKSVSFSHDSSTEVTFTIEVDFLEKAPGMSTIRSQSSQEKNCPHLPGRIQCPLGEGDSG